MTVQELNKEARELAQKLVNAEIDRLEIVETQKELKSQIELLIEQGADTSYDLAQGTVFVQCTESFSIPDGLKSETEVKSKDASKLNPELLQYFSPDLKLSAKAKKALRNGEDETLKSIVDVVEKEKLVVKIG
jgi:hypothetical protein